MAKKKKSKQTGKSFSAPEYIRTKMRNLPIGKCYECGSPEAAGICNILVSRKHPGGTISYAVYLVDTYCCGVKDTFFRFSDSPEEFDDLLERYKEHFDCKEIDYVRAHNLIYGAMEYAGEIGIEPHKDFRLTEYFLEEDNDDVPLIEYEFGHNGKPFLICHNPVELDKYRKMMLKVLNEDEFDILLDLPDEDFDDDYDEFEDFEVLPDDQLRESLYDIMGDTLEYDYDLDMLSDVQERCFHIVFPRFLLIILNTEESRLANIYKEYANLNPDADLDEMRKYADDAWLTYENYFQKLNPDKDAGDDLRREVMTAMHERIKFNILYRVTRERIAAQSNKSIEKLMDGRNNPEKFYLGLINEFTARYNEVMDGIVDIGDELMNRYEEEFGDTSNSSD